MSKAFTKEDDLAEPDIVRRPPAFDSLHLTRQGAERLRSELREFESERRKIVSADAGSLRLHELNRRVGEIQQTLALAQIVDISGNDDIVCFGAEVTVRSASDGEESRYRIVGLAEADAARGRISSASPLAQALLNHKVGERVPFKYPAGEDTLEILKVSY